MRGWETVYGPSALATANETKQQQVAARFTEQLLMLARSGIQEDFQHASPASVTLSTYGVAPRGGRATRGTTTVPIVSGVTLGGSVSTPVLGIIGGAPSGRTWVQFVVDSAGRVDTASIQLPRETDRAGVQSVKAVLPRVKFSPARSAGTPVCELQRMQVAFTQR
jgi:hypothetical protein